MLAIQGTEKDPLSDYPSVAARIYLTKPSFAKIVGPAPKGTLTLIVGRIISDCIREDLDLSNHSPTQVRFNLALALGIDEEGQLRVIASKQRADSGDLCTSANVLRACTQKSPRLK